MGGVACVLGGAGVSGLTPMKGSGVWHMARQRSLGGAYLAADVAAAHRVTRMLLDVLGLYKESCWLDALP